MNFMKIIILLLIETNFSVSGLVKYKFIIRIQYTHTYI